MPLDRPNAPKLDSYWMPFTASRQLATLDIYENDCLLTRAAELQATWDDVIRSLKGAKNVIDIRTLGLIAAIEIDSRHGAADRRAHDVFVDCLEKGLLIRVTGDTIALSPPLIIEDSQIDQLVSALGDALARAA
jgi:beta-alanine--pyruvate transaminase